MEQAQPKKRFRFTRTEKSWIMYDWANSVYATNIMAAIFPIVYAAIADDTGDKWYGIGVSVASLIVAILAPVLGTVGDYPGVKKKLFTAFLIIGVAFTATMAFVGTWQLMLVGFVLSRIGFSGANLFYDSFLTDVTTSERMDKVSAWGYAMGYIGGSTIPFLISIGVLLATDYSDLGQKFSILIVPVWWAIFSIPMLKNVKQVHFISRPEGSAVKAAFGNLVTTIKAILGNPGILLFLISYFFYIDGVDTVISVSTNYGSTLGLGSTGMILALLVTQIVAVPFSILFSRLSGKVGSVRMIAAAIAIYICICCVGFFMGQIVEPAQADYTDRLAAAAETYAPKGLSGEDEAAWTAAFGDLRENGRDKLYAKTTDERLTAFWGEGDTGIFGEVYGRLTNRDNYYGFASAEARESAAAATQRIYEEVKGFLGDAKALGDYTSASGTASTLFWVLACLVGTVQGGIQALSRSYFGKLIPPERSNEFFGFFDVFGKFAAVVGPLLYALSYMITGRASVGILSLILLFAAGLLVLIFGRKQIRAAQVNAEQHAAAEE